MSERGYERWTSIAVSIAAVAMAAAVIYQEFVPRNRSAPPQIQGGSYIDEWQDLVPIARHLGDSTAPVILIEFIDFECPACRHFHTQILPELERTLGASFSLALVHLPLVGHRFAKAAAHASECAANQGRFAAFVDAVMAKQDSLGLKTWTTFAEEIDVPDLQAFDTCVTSAELPPMVVAGIAAAQGHEIHATPTVLVNGWRVANATPGELIRVAKEVMAGRAPYPSADN